MNNEVCWVMGTRLNVIIAIAIVAGIAIAAATSFMNNQNVNDEDGAANPAATNDTAGPTAPVVVVGPANDTDDQTNGAETVDDILKQPSSPPAASSFNVTDAQNDTAAAQLGKIIEISNRVHLTELLSKSPGILNEYWGQPAILMAVEESVMFLSDEASEYAGVDLAGRSESGSDYSTTNVQVVGVDEPDYIKNDGQYAYIAMDNTLIIVDVWPASDMHVKTKVALDIGGSHIRDIFLNGDDLVIFYSAQSDDLVIREYQFIPQRSYKPVTHAVIIDVSDRESPAIRTSYSIDGWFEDARMIEDHVYIVTTSRLDYDYPDFPIILFDDQRMTPQAFYFDDESQFSTFTTLVSIDLSKSTHALASETFLMGDTGTYYVTHSNFYLTYVQSLPPGYNHEQAAHERFFKVIIPLLPEDVQNKITAIRQSQWTEGSRASWQQVAEILQDHYNSLDSEQRDELFVRIEQALIAYDTSIKRDQTRTVIHKVSINGSAIDYEARGSVPGRLLNQFSLGESGGGERLRVATTIEYYTEFGGFERSNSVYALDADLRLVGALEEVAPDERIYSARFMDDRLYMVTFQQVDPFFVIDISGDTPRILGELKIPGFSNYLHPYDDEHVIGIGRDTKLVDNRWVQPLGVKIALFNVADVSNPIVADEIIVGDSDTRSAALGDHKAFFFDRNRDMISMPIEGHFDSLKDTIRQPGMDEAFDARMFPGEYWSGFYVLDIDAIKGIDTRGIISHSSVSTDRNNWVASRTFSIDDVLYTVADSAVIASDIESLERLGFVKLTGTGLIIDYLD